MATSKYLMTEGNIKKRIINFAVPVFVGHLFQQLYNTADSLVVGRLVGSTALAAVSSVGTLVFMLVGFFMGFSQGAGIIIGNDLGAGNEEEVSKGVHSSVAVAVISSVVITVLGIVFSPIMLEWMDTPQDVMPEAISYLRWYFAGSTGLIFYNTFVSILQASGDSRHPLFYLIFSSLLNVVLDICFIKYFGMGVEGAALATSIAQVLSACLACRRLVTTSEAIRLSFRRIKLHRDKVRQIVRFGLPSALQACVIDLSNIMIQSYVNSFGSSAMAGIGAYSKVEGFSFLPTQSFSMALSTFISQNRGAGRKDRIRSALKFGLVSAVLLVEVVGAIMFIFCPQLIALFVDEPEVIAFGVQRARITALFYGMVGFTHVTSASLRGLGKPGTPTVVMLVCWCAVRVLVLLTIGHVYHEIALVSWIYPATWGLSTLVYLFYLRYLAKKGLF